MTNGDLERRFKQGCDVLRRDDNTKLVTKYIEHLSWLLFLKAFDAWEERQEALEDEHTPVIDAAHRWRSWASKDSSAEELLTFVAKDLLPYLRSLSDSPQSDLIGQIFRGINTLVKSGFNLKDVVEIVDGIDFHSTEQVHTISVLYESLLALLGEAGVSGEFYTPRPIIEFMVGAVSPALGERIYDPACGSAGFLVEAYNFMLPQERTTVDRALLQENTFFGQESGELPFVLGVMNMVLHGVEVPSIRRINTLDRDVRTIDPTETHHVILTNPPFGGRENPQIQQNFPVPVQATELLFVQHVMRMLKTSGGRCGIVVPEGVLFRGDAFARVKRELLEDFDLWALVSLPGGVFSPYSGVKTNLLFFNKGQPTKQTWYYELLPPEGERFTKSNPIRREHLADAAGKLLTREESESSWLVDVNELIERGYDFTARNPNRSAGERLPTPEEIVGIATEREREITAILDEIALHVSEPPTPNA